MTKLELIAKLEVVKDHSPVVSIDKMIAFIQQLEAEVQVEKVFGITQELVEEISSKLESILDNNSEDLVDLDSAEFELNYDNRVELSRVDVNTSSIRGYIDDILELYIIEEDEESENEDSTEEAAN